MNKDTKDNLLDGMKKRDDLMRLFHAVAIGDMLGIDAIEKVEKMLSLSKEEGRQEIINRDTNWQQSLNKAREKGFEEGRREEREKFRKIVNKAIRLWVKEMKETGNVSEGHSLAEDGIMPFLTVTVPQLQMLEQKISDLLTDKDTNT